MPAPILYEVNTRVWLRDLSQQAGRPVTLSEIPDSEIVRWQRFGFTHVWLMGVWQTGPEARRVALEQWQANWRTETPSVKDDVEGSPFAIQEYAIDSRLGTPLELLMLKERLGHAGIRLILDFVPNHLGLDSPEPRRYPARFVQAVSHKPGTFPCETKFGTRFFAHGRDPYFPPWQDTIQLDYRVLETRQAMSSIAQTISMFGEGLRCDMAMLLLPDVFEKVWNEFPCAGAHQVMPNFWNKAIPKIRELHPHCELIAEAYWDREQDLQEAGFNYTYNKRVTDYILRGQNSELATFLQGCSEVYLNRSVHFLENHDEPRVASILSLRRHKAAAALIFFLPGMVLLHDGQLEGRKTFARIQMNRRTPETPDADVEHFYEGLLKMLPQTHIRSGKARLIKAVSSDEPIVVEWEGPNGEIDLGIANLHAKETVYSPGRQDLEVSRSSSWECLYSTCETGELLSKGGPLAAAQNAANRVTLQIPPESAHILRLRGDR